MDAEDLTSLMTSYANAGKLSYDNNLATLGYADQANPQSVSIYPVDFEAKEAVLSFIEGLIAGVLAIAVVVLASFPVNAWALAEHQVENVMQLPVSSAAGLIPSRSAARRDPVEALRSE